MQNYKWIAWFKNLTWDHLSDKRLAAGESERRSERSAAEHDRAHERW